MKKWSIVLSWFAVIITLFFYDRELAFWIEAHRMDWLDPFMMFLTDFGLLFGVILFMMALFEKQLTKQLILITLAFGTALESSFLLKQFFAAPRPYETWTLNPLKGAEGFSFPSMHATFIFAALPFFGKGRLRPYRWLWAIFAITVAFSRVYVGVHYMSDIIAGGLLGYAIGSGLYYLEEHFGFTDWLKGHIKDRFEVRRQVGHAFIGLSIVFLFYLDLISAGVLLTILVIGGVLSQLSRWIDIPGLSQLLDYFERHQHRSTFPGKGSFFMVLGSLISIMLFPKDIAMAAIVIMALGDSVTNIFGRYFGEVKLPYNKKKTADGVIIGIAVATIGAYFFVPLHMALLASSVAMFVETLDLKVFVELDDNMLVPLVAGGVMMVF